MRDVLAWRQVRVSSERGSGGHDLVRVSLAHRLGPGAQCGRFGHLARVGGPEGCEASRGQVAPWGVRGVIGFSGSGSGSGIASAMRPHLRSLSISICASICARIKQSRAVLAPALPGGTLRLVTLGGVLHQELVLHKL